MTIAQDGQRSKPLFTRYWLPVIAYVGMITALSHRARLRVPFQFFEADKVVHAGEYLVLGLLLVRAFHASFPALRPLKLALIAICCGVVIGASDEYHQSFVLGREMSAYDLLADTVGLTLAQVLYRTFARG